MAYSNEYPTFYAYEPYEADAYDLEEDFSAAPGASTSGAQCQLTLTLPCSELRGFAANNSNDDDDDDDAPSDRAGPVQISDGGWTYNEGKIFFSSGREIPVRTASNGDFQIKRQGEWVPLEKVSKQASLSLGNLVKAERENPQNPDFASYLNPRYYSAQGNAFSNIGSKFSKNNKL
jgi:hypothetical protein